MTSLPLLILAGGFGTRLRSAVSAVPKPLAPVMGQPYLTYLLESWRSQGVTSFTFLLHHKADKIVDFLAEAQKSGLLEGCAVRTLVEPQPLGTGGALAYAVRELAMMGSFLVANADTWLGGGIQQLLATPAPAMAVIRVPNSERYGHVRIESNKISAFEEKKGSSGPGLINAGLYRLDADMFREWDERPFSLERELFPKWVSAGRLGAVPLETDFIDIGIPEDYFRFCRWIESKKVGVL
ncbi:sugar phosphate nucleotidyltransferase [Polaromonas sp.]|jgi:D-glycero-alpha-D-manno-heptose 1-phosphate guanylyltransferase|uniref:sugar phosphate nucleotidyltransferase n=1 Tax=Polaromonas sp. TaxID=1869339 RepID=UPI0037C7416D